MSELPASLYYIIGILVVGNLSAVAAFVVFIFKCGVFVADTKSGIKDSKDCGVRAHLRIDQIENKKRG